MRWLILVLLCITMGAGALPAGAVEPLARYDGFRTRLINPAKWFGYEANEKLSIAESVRVIQPNRVLGNRLFMLTRGYGRVGGDIGTASGGNRLRFANGNAVTAMQATVWVSGYTVTGNSLNSEPSSVKARLAGFFFNAGTPTPGSALNDVMAQVYVRRKSDSTDSAGILEVRASIIQCGDADCSTGATLNSAGLGALLVGQPVRLLLQWDQPNHQFAVKRDNNPTVYLTYAVTDISPPATDNNKRLEVQYEAANGTAPPRTQAYIGAFFDDVFVNQSALP